MPADKVLRLCVGGMVLYLLGALVFYVLGSKELPLMLLCGSVIWIVAIFIWSRNVEHGD